MMGDEKYWLAALEKTPFKHGDYVKIIDGRDSFTVGRVWGADINARDKSKIRLWVLISEAQLMTEYVAIEKCERITKEEWFKTRLKEDVQ